MDTQERIANIIAEELNIKLVQVVRTIELINEGNTIPFIARYRKEVTGGLSDETLSTAVFDLYKNRETYINAMEKSSLSNAVETITSLIESCVSHS